MVIIYNYFELKGLKKKDFQKITQLEFDGSFNKKIKNNDLPPNLTHLKFGYDFNHPIDLSKLVLLTHLEFGYFFNKKMDLSKLVLLTHLTFGSRYDYNPKLDILPQSLTHLNLGHSFNQSIDHLSKLVSLTHLNLGHSFNHPLDHLSKHNSLTHLTLGYSFNKSVDNLPSSLTHLTLGYDFKQPLDKLNDKLTHLTLESKFDQPIDNLPSSLTHLDLGMSYTKSIDNLMSLPNLKSIEPKWIWKKYKNNHDMCTSKVFTRYILLKQGISNSKKYGQLFLLFEKMCAEVKNEKDIYKLRGMAESLEIESVDTKSKEELCSEIGAEILIKLNLAKRFE